MLAPRREDAAVPRAVAPGSRELGLMLPCRPRHHLLPADVGVPLVMTSGNASDEPIAFEDGDAVERLSGIADLLLHDRPIRTRTDDSPGCGPPACGCSCRSACRRATAGSRSRRS